ncbi:MAG: hypothetical protein U5L96_00725 [Owenweeksia sp.]|nr:hypothetical protein [Owenweeksia sp.]
MFSVYGSNYWSFPINDLHQRYLSDLYAQATLTIFTFLDIRPNPFSGIPFID